MSASNIIPAFRYKDALAAITWLCNNLGFQKKIVFSDDTTVYHAQLTHGDGMIMISSERDTPFDKLLKSPNDIDGYNTQSAYIFVDNIKQHYDTAVSYGVDIVVPYAEEEHGTGYSCLDPEGHLWSFGNTNPWNVK